MELLSIVIPVFNEERTVYKILTKIVQVEFLRNLNIELILIDDGSSDNSTIEIQRFIEDYSDYRILLIKNENNKGKGYSLHRGFNQAKGDYILIQDADLEYDPTDYNDLLAPILDGFADVVYGSRFAGGKPHRMLFFWHSFGNKLLTFLCNIVSNLNLSDMECCYKVFKRELLSKMALKEKGFGFEPEITIKLSSIPDIRFYEVGVAYYGRTYSEGKKINYKDGFRAVYCIIRYGILKVWIKSKERHQ